MGYELEGQMGFGSSLVKAPGYLVRKFGEKEWQGQTVFLDAVAKTLWKDGASLNGEGISFIAKDISLVVGNRKFNLRDKGFSERPASTIFVFDPSTRKLKDIHSFSSYGEMGNTTMSRILLQNKENLVLAMSQAMNLPGFCDYNRVHPLQFCFVFGKLGSTSPLWGPIGGGGVVITAEEISTLREAELDDLIVERRANFLQIIEAPRAYAGVPPPVLIAHAGGGIEGQTYTNSLEALNLNYEKGHRFFEIDFSWTADGELVAIHDWEDSLRLLFHVSEDKGIPAKDEFMKLASKTGLTQLDLDQVLEWAKEKGDVYIVTDVKDNNIQALGKIWRDHGEFVRYVIPQVYNYQEYHDAKELGYENIILTLYRMKVDRRQLVDFAARETPFAITMPWMQAEYGLARSLEPWKIHAYAHTINDQEMRDELVEVGVDGFYTDFIAPTDN